MKYYLVAGEASGDLHGSNLIKNLKKVDANADFRCFGGEMMTDAGAELAFHYKDMSFSGIIEIVRNLRKIRKALKICKKDILSYKPDAVILIDYPGFNLKVAAFAKQKGISTLYYIAPKIWASRKYRIHSIRRSVDKLWVILPFEEDYFRSLGCEADYFGNPLADAIHEFKPMDKDSFRKKNQLSGKPVIALLAGSRKTEIRYCLPEMIRACDQLNGYELVIAGAPSIRESYYQPYIKDTGIKIVYNSTYDLLSSAEAALVTSGTATLETALFRVPEVVFYKVGQLTYLIGKPFFRLKFFSLVNLIMNREVVKEILQFRLAEKIRVEITRILQDKEYREEMLRSYDRLSAIIGDAGTSERVAHSMYNYLTRQL